MLAIAEILRRMAGADGRVRPAIEITDSGDPADRRISFAEYWSCRFVMLRARSAEPFFGHCPGSGQRRRPLSPMLLPVLPHVTQAVLARAIFRALPLQNLANSSVVGANLIPLLTLGIPGSGQAALIVSAFMIHGMQPGAVAVRKSGPACLWSVWSHGDGEFCQSVGGTAGAAPVGQGGIGSRTGDFCRRDADVHYRCWYGFGRGVRGVGVMLVFAALGYLLAAFGYPLVIVIIAFFLGPRFEISLAQAVALTNGDVTRILHHPVAMALLLLSVVTVVYLLRRDRKMASSASSNIATPL